MPRRSTVPRGRLRCRGRCNPRPRKTSGFSWLLESLEGVTPAWDGSWVCSASAGSLSDVGGRRPLPVCGYFSFDFSPMPRLRLRRSLTLEIGAAGRNYCLPDSPTIVDKALEVQRVESPD